MSDVDAREWYALLRAKAITLIEDTLWTELERQSSEEPLGPWIDRSLGVVNGGVIDMTAVAARVVELIESDTANDVHRAHKAIRKQIESQLRPKWGSDG